MSKPQTSEVSAFQRRRIDPVTQGSADDREPDDLSVSPISDAALDWFIRLQSGQGDPAIQEAFKEWLLVDSQHADAFEKIAEIWDMPELRDASLKIRAGLQQTGKVHAALRSFSFGAKVLPYAAAIALLAIGLHTLTPLTLWLEADYVTSAAARQDIVLPDGSKMTLDAASAVALDFDHGNRTVHLLKGEAYFDVVHDADHPFRVVSQFSVVEDIGTTFAVERNDGEDMIVLEQGAVEVGSRLSQSDKVRLQPGEIANATDSAISKVKEVEIAEALAWRQGRYIFREQTLGEVLTNLNRYYSGTVFVLDSGLNLKIVSGNYELADPVGAIRSLASVTGATMTVYPGGLIILR